ATRREWRASSSRASLAPVRERLGAGFFPPCRQNSKFGGVAYVPLPFKKFPLRPTDRTGNPRLQSVHDFEEGHLGSVRRVPDRRKVESADRSRERVDMKISFEEATGVR